MWTYLLPHARHTPCSFHNPWFYHEIISDEDYKWWSSPLHNFHLPLRPKYFPQPEPTSFPSCDTPSFTPTQNKWQNHDCVHSDVHIPTQQTARLNTLGWTWHKPNPNQFLNACSHFRCTVTRKWQLNVLPMIFSREKCHLETADEFSLQQRHGYEAEHKVGQLPTRVLGWHVNISTHARARAHTHTDRQTLCVRRLRTGKVWQRKECHGSYQRDDKPNTMKESIRTSSIMVWVGQEVTHSYHFLWQLSVATTLVSLNALTQPTRPTAHTRREVATGSDKR